MLGRLKPLAFSSRTKNGPFLKNYATLQSSHTLNRSHTPKLIDKWALSGAKGSFKSVTANFSISKNQLRFIGSSSRASSLIGVNSLVSASRSSSRRQKSAPGIHASEFSAVFSPNGLNESLQLSITLLSSAVVGVALAIVVVSYQTDSHVAFAQTEFKNPAVKNSTENDPIVASDGDVLSVPEAEAIVVAEVRSKFWPVLLGEWKMLLAVIVLTFAASLAELWTMKLGGAVIDGAMSKDLDSFMAGAWRLCGAVAIQGFLQFISYAALTQATERVRARLSDMAFASLIYQDKSFFDRHNSAELMNRLSSDVQEIRNVIKACISLGVKSTTSIVGGVIAAFAKSPSLALLVVGAIGSAVSIGSLYARFLRRLSRASKDANARAIACANEATTAVSTVQAFVGENREIERHALHLNRSVHMAQRFGLALGFFKGISTAGVSGILVGVLLYGGHLVSLGKLSVGDLSAFVVVASSIQSSLGNIAQLVGQLSNGKDAVQRVFTVIDSKPSINPKTSVFGPPHRLSLSKIISTTASIASHAQDTPTMPIHGVVQLNKVSFAYQNRPDMMVLQDVDITLESGKSLSLVGHSGSGKSTISRLILRFYDPVRGSVTIDGVDIKDMDPHWLRSQIGIVEQEPVLFGGTIWENIAYGRPTASYDEIIEAAKSANCDSFIRNFPSGYETVVGERGAQLSGGQKQRIAIARALLKNPKILILDEATSALDATTETLVQDALNRLMQNRTTLIIAHRLSTIKNSDTIVVLDQGKVVETGTHESLSQAKGFYAKLVKQQMGGKNPGVI